MADKKSKFKVRIDSDGTVAGTKVMVNGENVVEAKNVTSVNFWAHGGIKWSAEDKMSPWIDFSYRVLNTNPDGSETGETYSFSPKSEYPERGTIGKPVEKVSDLLVGRTPVLAIVDKITEMAEKAKRYIPDKETLMKRSEDSLRDLLSDIEKEIEG